VTSELCLVHIVLARNTITLVMGNIFVVDNWTVDRFARLDFGHEKFVAGWCQRPPTFLFLT